VPCVCVCIYYTTYTHRRRLRDLFYLLCTDIQAYQSRYRITFILKKNKIKKNKKNKKRKFIAKELFTNSNSNNNNNNNMIIN